MGLRKSLAARNVVFLNSSAIRAITIPPICRLE
jgi:hypothetical protein